MTDDTTHVKSEALTKVNRLAVVSIICAAIALAGTFRVGVVVIAVFAVGAGHVSPDSERPHLPRWVCVFSGDGWATGRTAQAGTFIAGGWPFRIRRVTGVRGERTSR